MNKIKAAWLLLFVLLAWQQATAATGKEVVLSGTPQAPIVLVSAGGEASLHFPQLAGILRLGMGSGETSFWLSEQKCERQEGKGSLTLTWRNLFAKGDSYVLRFRKLTEGNGFILETEGNALPADARLYWAFGGCYGQELPNKKELALQPAYCKDNVFSVEGTAFTVYYGESMRLRTTKGITPPQSDIRLSDAHRQQTPVALFQSGKKTDAHLLSAACPVKNGEKYYFCFYAQNRVADYNYLMLPELFAKESGAK